MLPKFDLAKFPDVALTPTPAGPVPIPYPNTKGIEQAFGDAFSRVRVICQSTAETVAALRESKCQESKLESRDLAQLVQLRRRTRV